MAVSLSPSGVLNVGNSHITLAASTPETGEGPAIFTDGGLTFTTVSSGLVVEGTTITPGGYGAAIHGTTVSLGPDGSLVVGSQTFSVPSTGSAGSMPTVEPFTGGAIKRGVDLEHAICGAAMICLVLFLNCL